MAYIKPRVASSKLQAIGGCYLFPSIWKHYSPDMEGLVPAEPLLGIVSFPRALPRDFACRLVQNRGYNAELKYTRILRGQITDLSEPIRTKFFEKGGKIMIMNLWLALYIIFFLLALSVFVNGLWQLRKLIHIQNWREFFRLIDEAFMIFLAVWMMWEMAIKILGYYHPLPPSIVMPR